MKTRYIKTVSIIEILLGLAMAGFGGFLLFLVFSGIAPAPMGIVGFIVGLPMILAGILLIIFGINLWEFKKWAWVASIVILVLVIALFAMLGFLHPIYFSGSAGAIICLILLALGIKKIFPTFP